MLELTLEEWFEKLEQSVSADTYMALYYSFIEKASLVVDTPPEYRFQLNLDFIEAMGKQYKTSYFAEDSEEVNNIINRALEAVS